MWERIKRMTLMGIEEYKDPYYQGIAAQLSFFFMMSTVPTIIMLSQVLGLLDISLDFIEQWISKYVRADMQNLMGSLIDSTPATSANIVMIVMALWAASKIQFSLTRIMDYTYSGGTDSGSYWHDRIRSMITVVFTIIAMAVMIVVFVYGEVIFKTLFSQVMNAKKINHIIRIVRWPVEGIMYFLLVGYIQYILPTRDMTFREIIPGSVFTSIGMLVVTLFYSIYVNYAANYNILYGSLANIVALMTWFYFMSWVLCIGILVNRLFDETSDGVKEDVVKIPKPF